MKPRNSPTPAGKSGQAFDAHQQAPGASPGASVGAGWRFIPPAGGPPASPGREPGGCGGFMGKASPFAACCGIGSRLGEAGRHGRTDHDDGRPSDEHRREADPVHRHAYER